MADTMADLDSIVAGLDFGEPGEVDPDISTEEVVDEPAAEVEADPVVEAKQEDPLAPINAAIEKFQRTGNPHDLPEPLRTQELARQADYTRKMQALKAEREKAEPPKVAPKLDLNADADEVQKQLDELISFRVAEATAATREAASRTDEFLRGQEQTRYLASLENHVRQMPGFSPEIESAMADKLREHVRDPEWQVLMGTKVGLELLFEQVKGNMSVAGKQDRAAEKVAAKQKATPRPVAKQGEPQGIDERYHGLSALEKLDLAVREATA